MKQTTRGNVRKIYDVGSKLVIVTSDKVSMFDVILPFEIPKKGEVLNRLSAFWFEFTKDIFPNYFISIDNVDVVLAFESFLKNKKQTNFIKSMPKEFEPRKWRNCCMITRKIKILPVECSVYGHITGGAWKSYSKTGSAYGINLEEKLKESQRLSEPIFVFTDNTLKGIRISYEQAVNLIGKKHAVQIRDKSIELYLKCYEYANSKGIIIANTKFEFGIDEQGKIMLVGEVITPNNSEFWYANKYKIGETQESFEKQYLNEYLMKSESNRLNEGLKLPQDVIDITSKKYIELYETLTDLKL